MTNLELLLYTDTGQLLLDLFWRWYEYSSVGLFAEGTYTPEGFYATLQFLMTALIV